MHIILDEPGGVQKQAGIEYPDAGREISGMRFKIAGARGAANLGITNLGDAERMEKDGASREDIWRKTGWWRGRDGKWRVELPDIKPSRGIVLSPRARRFQDANGYFFSFRLGELVDGGETDKAYPGLLDDITVHFRHGMPSYKASYAPESNTIVLSSRFMRKSDVYADEPTITLSPEATTLIAHELQHAIQQREGFSFGANADELNWTEYRNTMGEEEARNVQKRLNMTAEERAATPPWETEDVPEDRQIIRFKRNAAFEHSLDALQSIADGADYGVLHNAKYGEIRYPKEKVGRITESGKTKEGLGLLHIVSERMRKDGATLDEALDVAIKVGQAAEIGEETNTAMNTHWLDYDDVRAIVAETEIGNPIITGYEIRADETPAAFPSSDALQHRPVMREADVVAALRNRIANLRAEGKAGAERDIRFKRGENERAAALTEHVKYGKIHFVNHERLTNVIRGLVAGELKHPRFTKEEVAASKGTEHERLWSYILSLESSGADAERSEGSATRTGAATAQIRGGLDRLGSLATRYGRDPRDIIAEKGRFFDRGAESRVYLEENSGKVVKVRELKAVDTGGAVDILANIVYHNYLFPKDAYSLQDIVVWNKNGYDQFDLILEQPFVTPKTDANGNIIPPSEEQIIAALRKTPQRFSVWNEAWDREDSDEDSDGDFSSADFVPSARKIAYNGSFMVYDFKPGRNTFLDAKTGEVRFIDPRVAVKDPGAGFSVSRFGKRRIDRRGFDVPPSSEEDGIRFKRGENERAADDTSVWFGAKASMSAHGFDARTAKEMGLNITDKDTVAAARSLVADVRRMNEIETFALTSNRPLAAEEITALAILTRNLNADLGRINQAMAESANSAAFQAEKELVEARLNKAQDALDAERIEKGDIIEIVAFEPTQIKSATDNTGAFDGTGAAGIGVGRVGRRRRIAEVG